MTRDDRALLLRAWLSWFNVSLTTAFIPVFVLRLANALRGGKPALRDVPPWQHSIARLHLRAPRARCHAVSSYTAESVRTRLTPRARARVSQSCINSSSLESLNLIHFHFFNLFSSPLAN